MQLPLYPPPLNTKSNKNKTRDLSVVFQRKSTREPPRDGLVEEDEGQQSMGMNRPFLSLAQAAYGAYPERVM
jgi:hypothetical protein